MTGKFIANKNYILRDIAGEAILVSVGEEIADFCGVVNLNASARTLWVALQEEVTKEELVEKFVEEFEIPKEEAMEDVEAALQIMLERRLIYHV